jgi:HEAT repeat protein
MLIDDDPRIQAQGAFAACQDTDKARQLTAPLIGALRSKDAEVRRLAAQGLGQTDGTDANVVPALMAALSDSSWKVKRSAALALGQLGPKATQALPGLKKLSRASEKLVREAALKGIEQITKKY